MAKGYERRFRKEVELNAVLACWIINYSGWTKRAVRPRDLVRWPSDEVKIKSPEDIRKIVKEIAKEHKKKFWRLIKDDYVKE